MERVNDPQRNMAHNFPLSFKAHVLGLGPYVTDIYMVVHGAGVESCTSSRPSVFTGPEPLHMALRGAVVRVN